MKANTLKGLAAEFAGQQTAEIAKPEHYLKYYEHYFSPLQKEDIALLELGVYKGDSLELFARYFENAIILGLDINEVERDFSSSRIRFYQGLQDNKQLLEGIVLNNCRGGLDIVIDDCSHIGSLTLASFKILFPLVRPGGYYMIEDWGTGYWPTWPGGKGFDESRHFVFAEKAAEEEFLSHSSGLSGFVKQLVDEVAMGDITCRRGLGSPRASLFEYVHVYEGLVVIKKSQLSLKA